MKFTSIRADQVRSVQLELKPDTDEDIFTSPETFPKSMCGIMDLFNESLVSEFQKFNLSVAGGDFDGDTGFALEQMLVMMEDKMRGKRGLVRRTLGSVRSCNTMRCVVTPSSSVDRGAIFLNQKMFNSTRLMKMSPNGLFSSRPIKHGDYAFIGRPPSNNRGSMTAVRVYVNKDPGDFSMRVSISICDMNNMDYDGDECYLLFPCRDETETELARLYLEELMGAVAGLGWAYFEKYGHTSVPRRKTR